MLDVKEECNHGEKNYTNIRCTFWSTYILSELKSNLISQIQHENPDFIIFAGDATDHGYLTEYNDAASFVDGLKAISEVHSIPGNHDARNAGVLHFQRLIGERHFVRIDKKAGFAIIGLDSSKADVNSGDIGYDQMK